MIKVLSAMLLVVFACVLNAATQTTEVYAKVNGKNITDGDIKIILANNPNVTFEGLPPVVRDQILSKAIDKEVLSQKAMKSAISKSNEYKEALKIFEKNLSFNLWLKKGAEEVKVSDKEVKEFYNQNKDVFNTKDQVKANHILLDDEQKAKDLISKLKKSKNLKDDFIKLAKTESKGPSAPDGGDLGWFEKDKMVVEFGDAAFALKKDSITKKPVKTQFGYHIIYVEDKKISSTGKLKDVLSEATERAKAEKFQEDIKNLTHKLRKKAKIDILYKSGQ